MKSSTYRTISPTRALALLAAAGLLASAAACKKEEGEQERSPEPEKSAPKTTGEEADQAKSPPAASGDFAELEGSYKIDSAHSFVQFRVERMGMSYVPGLFTAVEGSMDLGAKPADSSVEISVDPASLFTGVKKRDDHLKSPDFLNAKQFPEIKFASKDIRASGEGEYEVTGELSLHGKKKEVEATIEQVGAGPSPMDDSKFLAGFHGQFTIQRSDFGIDFMSDGIGDDLRITFDVLGVRE